MPPLVILFSTLTNVRNMFWSISFSNQVSLLVILFILNDAQYGLGSRISNSNHFKQKQLQ